MDGGSPRRSALDELLAAGPEALVTPGAPPAASPEAVPGEATPEVGAGCGGSEVVATPEDVDSQGVTRRPPVSASPDIRKDILTYWYRGVFNGEPVPDRETFWFSLSAWQAVENTAATSACKAFGWWTTAPERGGVA